jgi:6-phosphogluconolactonase
MSTIDWLRKTLLGTAMMKVLWRAAGAVGVGAAMLLTGCNGFFVDPNTSTTTTTGSSTADYAYVVNSNGTVSEFVIGASTLTAISGSPFAPGSPLSVASSVVVNPTNAFAWVGGDGGIVGYTISSTGALSAISGGTVTEETNYVAMKISPNGDWLLALDNIANVVWVFSINTSTGVLTASGNYALPVTAAEAPARGLAIAANGEVGAVAEGAYGDEAFTFNQSTGALAYTASVSGQSGYSDDSVAFDSTSNYLLVGRGITSSGSSEIISIPVTAAGALGTTGTNYAVGEDPYALLVDNTGTYVYAADKGASTVSAYTIASGVLTQLSSSPYESGPGVTALAEDINSKYVLAAATGSATVAGDSADLTLYSLDAITPGQLDPVATAANGSGVSGSVYVATTHPQ